MTITNINSATSITGTITSITGTTGMVMPGFIKITGAGMPGKSVMAGMPSRILRRGFCQVPGMQLPAPGL